MKDISVLKQYIHNVSKYPRVTPEEEISLAKKIRRGGVAGKTALNKLVNANLKLVVKIAVQLTRGHGQILDVIQNGNLGLIKAAQKFDPHRGVRFSTYSAFWIKQAILRGFIKPSSGVAISYRKDEVNKKVKAFIREFFAEDGKYPSVETVMKELRVKRSDAVDGLLAYRGNGDVHPGSFSAENGEDALDSIPDNRYNPETAAESFSLVSDVRAVLEGLPERECEIIRKRYGFDPEKETLSDLGKKYSISAEATRQIEKRVLGLLRSRFPELAYYAA